MFDALRTAIEELEIPLDRGHLRRLVALRDRLDARIAGAVGDYDADDRWNLDGSTSMAAWLKHETRCDPQTASRMAARGRKLRALPTTNQAFLDGVLTGGQVDIVLAHVSAKHLELFASHEAEVVPSLVGLSIEGTTVVMGHWRRRADALDDGPAPAERASQVFLSTTIDSRGELRGSLDADLHASVEAALRVADCGDRDLLLSERRAEALGTVCRFFLDQQPTRTGGRHRAHLNVALTVDDLGAAFGGSYVDTGLPVSPAELGALRCDSVIHRLLVSGAGAILDYGRATRTWAPDLYNAIACRDRGCRWPGCDRPASWADVHHVTPWEDGGETSVENGVMLCRRHHRKVHGPAGWSAKLLPDATLEVTHPDGRVESSKPRGPIPQQFWRAGGG